MIFTSTMDTVYIYSIAEIRQIPTQIARLNSSEPQGCNRIGDSGCGFRIARRPVPIESEMSFRMEVLDAPQPPLAEQSSKRCSRTDAVEGNVPDNVRKPTGLYSIEKC
jgi:hypothetical protein